MDSPPDRSPPKFPLGRVLATPGAIELLTGDGVAPGHCLGKLAEIVAQYMRKGLLVYVEGRLQTHSWKEDDVKHYRTEVIAEQVWLPEWSNNTDEHFTLPTEELPV